MNNSLDPGLYYHTMIEHGMYTTEKKLKSHLKQLFRNYDFKNKVVLDLGSGNGLQAFYMASMGAEKIICLEPGASGSSGSAIENFHKIQDLLKVKNVELEHDTFQDYDAKGLSFDLILSNKSLNHLDEQACINLLVDPKSRQVYNQIFQKLFKVMKPQGKLIISDCSRHNFFNLLQVKNFFVPTIEWEKHQTPFTWSKLAKEAGFIHPEISWNTFNSLAEIGKMLTSNPVFAYFTLSSFRLILCKPQ